MHCFRVFRVTCTILLLASSLPAMGQQRLDTTPASRIAGAIRPAPEPVAAAFMPQRFHQAPAALLEQTRGGSDAAASTIADNIASDTQLRGTTDNNNATNVVTGNNMIQSSFSSAAGIPVVIQNTGANVLIQNATVVNLQFK